MGMSFEEAITRLVEVAKTLEPDSNTYIAFRMAVEALWAQERQDDGDSGDKMTPDHFRGVTKKAQQQVDMIDRRAAIEAIEEMQMPIMRSEFPEEQYVFTGMSEALSAIKALPSAQPERKTGRWIDEGQYADFFPHHAFCCSECGHHLLEIEIVYDYCPFCGTKMEVAHETD